ncbi:uracil-DNA glycosylase [Oscillatoria amoena NRMC-F 0135]|nr:uracil-DNA glycosylase [Oscillatoria laete-virens]MDL5051084.1 uracil-DNA glycosylase [Oscillatoria amoena NRMC-F 0135]MDL5054531.1 uracil-DNA glycosylase [Oscillatoria laete-virens NRMC-F 0139]
MTTPFHNGLDAVIGYLHSLRDNGLTHVEVSRSAVRSLSEAPPAPAPSFPSAPPAQIARANPVAAGPAPVIPAKQDSTAVAPMETGPAFGAPLSAQDKEEEFRKLRERALACRICPHLARTRKQVVFGVGTIHARLMFVGEAPGADEDAQGEPFVGRAGQLLTKMIQAMGLERADIYIGNILKCRPDMPVGASGNRPPTADEIANCRPYIISQIDIIRPEALVALGSSAVRGLLGVDTGIGKLRGKWMDFRGIPVMPTFHPSYLLRKAGPSGLPEKRKAWEDLLQVMERLGLPISDKQRNYFLNAIQS